MKPKSGIAPLPLPRFVMIYLLISSICLFFSYVLYIVTPSVAWRDEKHSPSPADYCIRSSSDRSKKNNQQKELQDFITRLSSRPRFTFNEKQQALEAITQQIQRWSPSMAKRTRRMPYCGDEEKIVPSADGTHATYDFFHFNGTNIWTVVQEGESNLRGGLPDIILLMAHYDSVRNMSATFDNAAGVGVAMLTAKLIESIPKSDTARPAIWLLLTDYEERLWSLSSGANHFLKSIPEHQYERIKAVINIDSIGAWSMEPNSQEMPYAFPLLFPLPALRIKNNGYRGNFVASIAAGGKSSQINDLITRAAEECSLGQQLPLLSPSTGSPAESSPLNLLPLSLRLLSSSLISGPLGFRIGTSDLCRSDHYWFWKQGIPAVHLTDTANFRTACYHESCDNSNQLRGNGTVNRLIKLSEILASTINLYQKNLS